MAGPGNQQSQRTRCPFLDLVDPWLAKRSPALRDADGLELLRAYFGVVRFKVDMGNGTYSGRPRYPKPLLDSLNRQSPEALKTPIENIRFDLGWIMRLAGDPADYAQVILDSAEGANGAGMFRTDRDDADDKVPDLTAPIRGHVDAWIDLCTDLHRRGLRRLPPPRPHHRTRTRPWRYRHRGLPHGPHPSLRGWC